MRKRYALLCVIGGFLSGAKPVYDGLILDRRIHTGITLFDWTDYIKFVFPLLCLGALYFLHSFRKKPLNAPVLILSISLILQALFHFSEIYLNGSDIPFGLVFLLTGMVTLLVGSVLLANRCKNEEKLPKSLFHIASTLSLATLLFCLLPFISNRMDDSIEGAVMVGLMMIIGLAWAGIGIVLFRFQGEQLEVGSNPKSRLPL